MEKDKRQSGGPEQVAGNRESQRAPNPAPGKVTRTSRLSSSREPAVQRKAAVTGPGAGAQQARSAWDLTMDPWMDAAHRGTSMPDTVVQRKEDAPERLRASAPVGAPGASLRGDETETDATPTFKGFENDRYQEHDKLIEALVTEFNKNKQSWVDATAEQVSGIPDLDAALVKSWLIQEAGGNDKRSKAAWSADPAQVNVPGDWNEHKASLGLEKPKERNEGTLQQNMKAAIIYLARKGFGSSGQPPVNRPKAIFDGWETALQRYNGRTDETENGKKYGENYADRIVGRSGNPDENHQIELPKPK